MEIKQWMTQREAADLLDVKISTINEHVVEMRSRGLTFERDITLSAIEGKRRITRVIKHIDISAVHAVAVKSRRFTIANQIQEWAAGNGSALIPLVVARREVIFSEMLECLSGICDIVPQYRLGNYVVDFFIPSHNLAIEFDESHHSKTVQKDRLRQSAIEATYGTRFIRVREGGELAGLREIVSFLFNASASGN